jgi:hypothetical protein
VTLKQDDDQAIQLFDWAGTAVQRADTLAQEISDLRTKYKSAEDTISQLNSRLEELVQAKNEHDDQLIAKFAKLLNEKKLKIRNQQRLLATADVNSAKRKASPRVYPVSLPFVTNSFVFRPSGGNGSGQRREEAQETRRKQKNETESCRAAP